MNIHKHWVLLGIFIFYTYQTPTYPSLEPTFSLISSKTVLSSMVANSHMGLLIFQVKVIKLQCQFFSLIDYGLVLSSHIPLDSAALRNLLSTSFSY